MTSIMIRCVECGYQFDECDCIDDIPVEQFPSESVVAAIQGAMCGALQ